MIFNIMFNGVSAGAIAAFLLNSSVFTSPGYNIPWLLLGGGILIAVNGLTYGLFSMAMPRSGGDYHFISRTLHPSLGFMSGANWLIWLPFSLGIVGGILIPIGIGSCLTAWGVATGNAAFLAAGNTFGNSNFVFAISTLFILLWVGVTLLGNKTFFRVQNIAFLFTLLAFVITPVVFLSNSPSTYQATIDRIYGSGTYNSAISVFQANNPNLGRTAILAIPAGLALVYGTSWTTAASFVAGEIRNEKKLRTWIIANVLSAVVSGAMVAVTAYLYFNSVGQNFVYAVTYLNGTPHYNLTVPAYYSSFVALGSPNPIVFLIFAIGFTLGGIYYMAANVVMSSRVLLAWSFDRAVPRVFGKVDRRFHAPWVAILFVLILSELSLVIYVYTNWLGLFSDFLAVGISFILVGISAAVFPFRRKAMFESSVANIRLGGVPLMSIIGAANVSIASLVVYQNLTDSTLGANSFESIAIVFGGFVVYFALYWIIRAYRKRQNIDIDALYRQIPPE
jgi:amino acid transporter